MQYPKFVQFPTSDGLTLPGLLFEVPHAEKSVIYLHGNGGSSIFYSEDRTFVESMQKNGITCLLFNNRGAGIIQKLNRRIGEETERKNYGMAYEIIKECVYDIDGAINFLEEQVYKEIYLIGLSTGANKICVYNHYKPENNIRKYVLLAG